MQDETLSVQVTYYCHATYAFDVLLLHCITVLQLGLSYLDTALVCKQCKKHSPAQSMLSLMQHSLPTQPWEKFGTDIIDFNGKKYLMIIDYYSRYPVIRL